MSIKCDEYGPVCVIDVDGPFTAENAAAAREALAEQLDHRRAKHFVIHLARSASVDSAGLEALLWMKHRCEEQLGQFKVAGMDETCRLIMKLTRLEHRLECFDDLTTAVKTLR